MISKSVVAESISLVKTKNASYQASYYYLTPIHVSKNPFLNLSKMATETIKKFNFLIMRQMFLLTNLYYY